MPRTDTNQLVSNIAPALTTLTGAEAASTTLRSTPAKVYSIAVRADSANVGAVTCNIDDGGTIRARFQLAAGEAERFAPSLGYISFITDIGYNLTAGAGTVHINIILRD